MPMPIPHLKSGLWLNAGESSHTSQAAGLSLISGNGSVEIGLIRGSGHRTTAQHPIAVG